MFFNDTKHIILFSSEEAELIKRDFEALDCIFGETAQRYELWMLFDFFRPSEVSLLSFELMVLLVSLKVCSSIFASDEVRDSLIERLSVYIEENC